MPTTHNHLVCFLGRNGSGKSYRANQLVKEQNYVKVSMADTLRELAWKSLGWRPKDDEEYDYFKNNVVFVPHKLVELNPDLVEPKNNKLVYTALLNLDMSTLNLTGRQYLQNLGQGCKTLFGEDFWVKQWEKKVLHNSLFMTDDNYDLERNKELHNQGLTPVFQNTVKGKLYPIISQPNIKNKKDQNNNILTSFIGRTFIVTDDIRFPIEIEAAHKLGATFIWCDYQQGNYPKEEHSSEALANKILASGKYKDGDEIEYSELKAFFN